MPATARVKLARLPQVSSGSFVFKSGSGVIVDKAEILSAIKKSSYSTPPGPIESSWVNFVRSTPRDVALGLLRQLKAQGKVLAYKIDETEPNWWTIRLVMSEENYFNLDIRREVVRQITDAIDRRFHIFTLVRLIPEHRAGYAIQR